MLMSIFVSSKLLSLELGIIKLAFRIPIGAVQSTSQVGVLIMVFPTIAHYLCYRIRWPMEIYHRLAKGLSPLR